MPSDVEYWQDEDCHSQRIRRASRGGVTMNGGTYVEGLELTEWRMVRNLVGAVLPAPVQDRLRQLSSGLNKGRPVPAKTRPAATRGAPSAGKADTTTEPVPPLPPRRQADEMGMEPAMPLDRRAISTGYEGGKWFSSLLASVAANQELAACETSGVEWRFGSLGLGLILNSGREFLGNPTAGPSPEFERATYINGAQHVLRGLPRDLEPAEAAMLHRAMPPALAAAALPDGPNGGGSHHQQQRGHNRNRVHAIAFALLWCLYSFVMWLAPMLLRLGSLLLELEVEHRYGARVLLTCAQLLHGLYLALCWARHSTPGKVVLVMADYTSQGVAGAIQEFVEMRGGPGMGGDES